MDEQTISSFVNKSSRNAYGAALYRLAESDDRIVAVTADVSASVRLTAFEERWPRRFFNFGIAEQNMMAAAAGLALEGKIPFVSVYAVFAALRAIEQARTDIAYANLPVRICVSHSGISVGQAGPSHHSIEDVAIFRSIPNMTVIVPADGLGTAMLLRSIKDVPGPVYVRLSRAVEPTVYATETTLSIWKAHLIRQGDHLTIIACGASVGHALRAAEMLAQRGVQARVIDMHTIKPIDQEVIIDAARQTGRILTVEEHSIIGGLGSSVAEVLAEAGIAVRFKRLGLPDAFTISGPYPDLQKYYGLDAKGIAQSAQFLLVD
jgi:transketolase